MATAFQADAFQNDAFQIDAASTEDAELSVSGVATVSFGGAATIAAVLSATGTGNAVFGQNSFGGVVELAEHAPASGQGAGGFAKAWTDYWEDKWRRDKKRDYALEKVRDSEEYRRLKRKLRMYREHLLDAQGWREQDKIESRISEIEARMQTLEDWVS